MNLDSSTLLIIGAAFVALLLLLLVLRRGGGRDSAIPPSDARGRIGDGPEGNGVTDGFAAATRDVAGEMLGVEAQPVIPAPDGPPDDLRTMKGVGPKLAATLNENGVTRFDQLAGLGETEIAILDEKMGAFRGRLVRDRIVEQACYLAGGDTEGFEAKFGKLGSGNLA
jgi:predicted flap endonuclease-1-like 5' DNA nuclease